MSDIEQTTRMVIQAVRQRLGSEDPAVLELVVREVVTAMSAAEPQAARREGSRPASDNGDGTVTTGLGATVQAAGGAASLEFCASCTEQSRRDLTSRAIVTTTGKNARGMVAQMATTIAEGGGDILDISQTIVSDFFTMIIVVDIGALHLPFSEFKDKILDGAKAMGVQAVVIHEDVLRSLQRV